MSACNIFVEMFFFFCGVFKIGSFFSKLQLDSDIWKKHFISIYDDVIFGRPRKTLLRLAEKKYRVNLC